MRLYQRITGLNKKRISKLIVVTILFLSVSSVFLNSSIVVYAWSAGGLRSTIASIIVSMLMSSGAGVTNMEWLNQLNTAYGVESSIGTLENAINQGLLTESAGTLIDTGLSDAIMANSAYTDLGLDALFSTTADDAIIQAGTVAASGGANIAAESIGAVTLGTVGQAFVAVGAGIGLGVLANHVIERFGKYISQGKYINKDSVIDDFVSDGQSYQYAEVTSGINHLITGYNLYPYYFLNNRNETFGVLATNDTSYTYRTIYNGNIDSQNTRNLTKYNLHQISTDKNNFISACGRKFDSRADFEQAVNDFMNGASLPDIYSPDVITKDGNAIGQYDNGYQVPSITPYYNPQNKGLKPIDMDDYMDYARSANDLTDEDKTGTDQADNFKDFINPYLEDSEPEIPEIPPNYTDPDVIPEQPDYNPKTPVSETDINDSDPYTTPDLMERFPFCIPNDILAIFNNFKMSREAPVIDWEFKYDAIGLDQHLVIDFEDFDDAASLLRTLELILFVVGLGVSTRKLIGV